MDLFDFEELEKMARNAIHVDGNDLEDVHQAAERWQKLFGYSHSDAIDAIEKHRNNLCRSQVSDKLWDLVQAEYRPRGYTKEAYEHELEIGIKKSRTANEQKVKPQASDLRGQYLVKLTEFLTTGTIRTLAGLAQEPEVIEGYGDECDARFSLIDGRTKHALVSNDGWPSFGSIIVRIPQPAEKKLSAESAFPTLGLDTTLPQYRPSHLPADSLPEQDQYPVWYFFYGTLAEPERLTSVLGLLENPSFVPAIIRGGVLQTWAGKYKALVDGPPNAEVAGKAYLVKSKEHEDALRAYETAEYEVVRCLLDMGDRQVPGCTFRFVGDLG